MHESPVSLVGPSGGKDPHWQDFPIPHLTGLIFFFFFGLRMQGKGNPTTVRRTHSRLNFMFYYFQSLIFLYVYEISSYTFFSVTQYVIYLDGMANDKRNPQLVRIGNEYEKNTCVTCFISNPITI